MANCKDCIHVEVCRYYTNELAKANGIPLKVEEIEGLLECDDCEHFKGRSRFVELPCKVGDTLYTVVRGYKIREWIVTDICFSDYLPISVMVITARDKRNSEHIRFADHYLGKTVFLTREAAEQALKEREK